MAGGLNRLWYDKKQADNDRSQRYTCFFPSYGFLDYGLAVDIVLTAYKGTFRTNPDRKPAEQH